MDVSTKQDKNTKSTPDDAKKTLKTFCESTSVKGVPKVLKTQQKWLKIIWFIAVVIGASVAFYQLSTLLVRYFRFESVTKLQYCNNCHAPFPDVTVCNLNPLNSVNDLGNDILDFDQFLDYIFYLSHSGLNTTKVMEDLNMDMSQLTEVYYATFSPTGYFQNINQTAIKLHSRKPSHNALIQDCTWYGWDKKKYQHESCMDQSIYTIYNPEYFMCYTLHINDTNTLSKNSDIFSMQAKLYLNDFAERLMRSIPDNIFQSQARGARILIHPPNTLPDISNGFNIPPGHEVLIKLKATESNRLSEPYAECTNKIYLDSNEANKFSSNSVVYHYSDEACLNLCHQAKSLKDCKCFNPHFLYTESMTEYNNNLPQCGYVGKDINDVIERVWCYLFLNSKVEENSSKCKCLQPCHEYSYDYEILQTTWPHESYHLQFYQSRIQKKTFQHYFSIYERLLELSKKNTSRTFEELRKVDLIERNFIDVKVLFQKEGHQINTDVPAVTFDALFGSMGGILNLWIGITFFTVIEFLDLVLKLIEGCLCRKKKGAVGDEKNDATVVMSLDQPVSSTYYNWF